MYRRYLIEIQHAKRKVNKIVHNCEDILTDGIVSLDESLNMEELREESLNRLNEIAKKVANEKRTFNRTVADEDVRYICSLYTMFVDKATPDELHEYRREVANVMVKTNIVPYLTHIAVIYPADVYSNIATYKDTHLLFMTLTLIAYYTDSSDMFTEAISRTEVVVFCKRLLTLNAENHLNGKLTDILEKTVKTCICIFHVLSMNETCLDILRDLDLITTLQPYLKSSDDDISLTSMAVLANIATEKDYGIIKANAPLVAKLMYMLHKGMEDESHVYEGWPCKRSGRAVQNLSKNDSNKKLLWDLNVSRMLTEMVRTGNEEQQLQSVHAIWALSFDKEIREDIMKDKNSNILQVLKGLEKNTTNTDIKNACEKSLWTLNLDTTETPKKDEGNTNKEVRQSNDSEPKKGHIMLSYQGQSRETVKEIKRVLEEKNYNVWMDIDKMGGSTLQAMADAVENAYVVLICYSRKYKESENCRLEAEYTQELRKPFIPLKMEQGYKPDGWLGLMIGSRYFIDFSGKYKFEDKLVDLFRELDRIQKPDTISKENTITVLSEASKPESDSKNIVVTKPTGGKILASDKNGGLNVGFNDTTKEKIKHIRVWTQDDVFNWLSKYDLHNRGLDELTGEEIWLLTKVNYETPDRIYDFLDKDLKLDTLLVKSRLIWALTDLLL